jgi:hypothetical protein
LDGVLLPGRGYGRKIGLANNVFLPSADKKANRLGEVEELIGKFEEKHGFSTIEFLKNPALRTNMFDDEIFQWEAFEAHREELQRLDEELRRRYLECVTQKADQSLQPVQNNNLALAA